MNCWIGVEHENERWIVRLAGRLGIEQVPELLGACCQRAPLELNLTELVSVDAAGIEALQRIRREGAKLVGVPGYIQLRLDSLAAGSAGSPPLKGPQHR